MARRNGGAKRADLLSFRDLDLMLALSDAADEEGWAETEHLARSLGFGDEKQALGIRFSWMRRYGILEGHRDKAGTWRLTDGGLRVVEAKLRAGQHRNLEEIPEEALVEAMADITHRYHRGSAMVATMLRREFLYGTAPRR
jgi:hypothetical protein